MKWTTRAGNKQFGWLKHMFTRSGSKFNGHHVSKCKVVDVDQINRWAKAKKMVYDEFV